MKNRWQLDLSSMRHVWMKNIKKLCPGTANRNRPKQKSSHLQMGLVGGEVKVLDKNGGQTRGVLQSHMEEYGIR